MGIVVLRFIFATFLNFFRFSFLMNIVFWFISFSKMFVSFVFCDWNHRFHAYKFNIFWFHSFFG
jgi:hypothetical protein